MNKLIAQIDSKMRLLEDEMDKCMTNKAASRRARKLTLELEKDFKQFRKDSVKHDKG